MNKTEPVQQQDEIAHYGCEFAPTMPGKKTRVIPQFHFIALLALPNARVGALPRVLQSPVS